MGISIGVGRGVRAYGGLGWTIALLAGLGMLLWYVVLGFAFALYGIGWVLVRGTSWTVARVREHRKMAPTHP